jgi:hypothetical protein
MVIARHARWDMHNTNQATGIAAQKGTRTIMTGAAGTSRREVALAVAAQREAAQPEAV